MKVEQRAIDQAEKTLGVSFPHHLKIYLQKYGWLETETEEFFGLGANIPIFLDIVTNTLNERKASPALPKQLLPILNDGFGNNYCVNCVNGSVVFWDHDLQESQIPQKVADSLEAWLKEFEPNIT